MIWIFDILHKNSKKAQCRCSAVQCTLTSQQRQNKIVPDVKTVNVFPHCFVLTFPEISDRVKTLFLFRENLRLNLRRETGAKDLSQSEDK